MMLKEKFIQINVCI